jgi:peroxiredoxin
VYCVNDAAVMQAWAKNQKVGLSKLNFMGDPTSELTRALDMELIADGPRNEKGLINRCKRFAMFVDDGEIKVIHVAEAPGDPAGDENPDATMPDAMLEAIAQL